MRYLLSEARDEEALVPIYGPRDLVLTRVQRDVQAVSRHSEIETSSGVEDVPDDDGYGYGADQGFDPFTDAPMGLAQVAQLMMQHPTVSACAITIGQAMIQRGYRIVPRKDPDGKPIANPSDEEGERVTAFWSRPHPDLTTDQLLGAVLPMAVASGRFFFEIGYTRLVGENGGRLPGALFPDVPQGQIRALINASGEFLSPAWAQLRSGGRKPLFFERDQILWLQFPGPIMQGIFPMGPVSLLRIPIGIGVQAKAYIHSFFTSGGKLGLVFKMTKPHASPKEYARAFGRMIERKFSNTRAGFRCIVLYNGMEIEDPPKSGAESGIVWQDIQKIENEAICGVFRVDPRLVGFDRGGNLGGKGEREQAWSEMINNAVMPRVRAFNAAITRFHRDVLQVQDWDFELLPERINANEESRATVVAAYKQAQEAGLIDRSSLDDCNAGRAEFNPDLAPLTAVPEIVEVSSGDDGIRSASLGRQTRAASSLFVRRFDVRSAKKLLGGIEDDLGAELLTGFRKGLADLTRKLDAAYATGDQRAILKLENWEPGRVGLEATARKLWRSFYGEVEGATEAELAALLVETRARKLEEDAIADGTAGDVVDFIDLANLEMFDDLFGTAKKRALKTFREGLGAGWSRGTFVEKLEERFGDVAEHHLSTAVRTSATDFFNLARQRVFAESGGAVESVEFTAILDDRTTPVCQKLDGVIFQGLDDPNLDTCRPPLHYNCRSTLVPIMVGEDFRPSPQAEVRAGIRLIQSGFGKA